MALSNDALMAKLFKWTTVTDYRDIKFYQRIVGDAVIDDARREALLESRKLRRNLRNVDSTDYLIYIDPLEDLEDSELREMIVVVAMRDVMREYLQANPRAVLAPLGDNPSQEDQEEYEAAREQRDVDFVDNMTAHVEAWRVDFEKTLENKERTALMHMCRKVRVDDACEQCFTETFENQVVCASVYTDDKYKTRMFTLEQYMELPHELRTKLRNAYNTITIDPDSLKN